MSHTGTQPAHREELHAQLAEGVAARDRDELRDGGERIADVRARVRPDIGPGKLERVVRKYISRKFETNPFYLLGAFYEYWRLWRTLWGRVDVSSRMFCSQLAADVLQDFGVIGSDVDPADVVPADFRSPDQTQTLGKDRKIPGLFDVEKTFTFYPRSNTSDACQS